MKIGCFISQKRAGDRRRNTTRLALLYRKHVQGNDAIGNALCTMLKQIYWFSAQVKDRNKGNNWKYLGPHCALVPAEENEGSEDRKVSCWRQNFVCFAAQLNCANLCFLLIRRYIAPTTVVLGLLQDLPLYTIVRSSSPLEKLKRQKWTRKLTYQSQDIVFSTFLGD
jgi:hypothetical protein